MKTITILLLLIILYTSCDDNLNTGKGIAAITKIAKNKYNLECIASGMQGPNIIKNFRLIFETNKIYSEDEARELLIEFTEDYIYLVNSTEKIIKNIDNPPANEKHAFFLITFVDYDGSYRPQLNAIELSNGNFEFLKKTHTLEPYKTETYSEAYFKVYGTKLNRTNYL